MDFTLPDVVPWGRSLPEYIDMFALSETDLARRILGCGDGPASFNAELTRRGGTVVSVDPLYRFAAAEIRDRIERTYDIVLEETRRHQNEFVWERFRSVEGLGQTRMAAMQQFLEDYAPNSDRYVTGELPSLPFADGEFELALCAHFLFLYGDRLSTEFHVRSLVELCRVATDVRVFPLQELGMRPSRHVEAAIAELKRAGFDCAIESVAYEFQKGGNRMLRVRAGDRAP